MLRFLVVVLIAAAVSIFAVRNMDRVEVTLIVRKPVHVRLFFLLLTSFLAGSLSAVLVNLYARTKSMKKKGAVEQTEDDEFFPK